MKTISQRILWAALALMLGAGCRTSHDVNMTHEVKPIHITLDINLKIDQQLDDFFGDIDQAGTADSQSTGTTK